MVSVFSFNVTIIISILSIIVHTSSVRATEPVAPKLKGLIITGGCCHDYENQKTILSEGISQRFSMGFDIVHEGGDSKEHLISIYTEPDWAKGYDVIIHNECFGAVKDAEFIKKIAAAHFSGIPGVFIHCSMHSYRGAGLGAEPWREMIGITSTSHEKGASFKVENIAATHPIMKTFPQEWITPKDELYKVEKQWMNVTPLAKAYGVETKKEHTVIWTNEFAHIRSFGISVGHSNETMITPEWLDVVARGTMWAVNKLEADGSPSSGYNGTGIKPIKIRDPKIPAPDPKLSEKAEPAKK